ncbi:MAG: ATP phosphoribosyltransferase [Faecalibacterium sp.]
MELDLSCLQPKEQASFALRALYEAAGCRKYHMGRFEEYGLYQANRSFLSSEQVITFTDLDGRLLALKPDVTLSIAKTAQPAPGQTLKYYYSENVYRPSAESHTFKEISQMGLELLGRIGQEQLRQTVQLAAQSLAALGRAWVLEVSHMGYLSGLLDALSAPERTRPLLLEKLRAKNVHELRAAALDAGLGEAGADALAQVLGLSGAYPAALERAAALCRNDAMAAAVAELQALAEPLAAAGGAVRLDLTLTGEMEYYNGLVFQGYLQGLPRPLLKGGRYDLLMQKFTPGAGAIGFAVYLDELDRLSAPLPPVQQQHRDRVMLSVALPKGRLGDKVYNLLARIGYGCPEDYNATRKLVVENPAAGIRYFLVKPSDVAIYVEHGAADVGIVGKDILTEAEADVYELLDTGLGKCRMCVAAPADYCDDPSRPVRVATKFVSIAKSYYASIGRDIEIIKLNGSIELAPILGLSDVIVDIVETGTTLRENGLKVVTEFMPISARFIANKASYQFKHREMETMLEKLRSTLEEEKNK